MKKAKPKPVKSVMSVRVSDDLRRRLAETADAEPYRVTFTSLVERGIELALKELREIRSRRDAD